MPRSQFLSLSHTCAHKHTLSVPLIVSLSLSISLFLYLTLSVCFSVSHFLYVSVSPSRWSSLSLRFSLCLSETEKNDLSLSLSLSITDVLHSLSLCYVILYYQFLSHFLSVRVSPLCLSYSLNFSLFLSHRVCPCLSLSVTVSPTLSPSVFLSLSVTFSLSIPDTPTLSLLCHILYYQFLRFGLTFCLSVSLLLSRYQFLSHFLGLSVSFTRSLSHAVL